ncbi:MAG TPA: nuclear transport factor 2 family protein [Candidatus Binataceae bacterium]
MSEQESMQTDREAISEVVYRYAVGADSRDAAMFASVFTDELTVLIRGGSFGEGRKRTVSNQQFGQAVTKALSRFPVTQHFFSVYKVDINGDQAQTLVYMQARHFIAESEGAHPPWDMGGYYEHHLVRTPSGWKVRDYTLNITWEQNIPLNPPSA